MLLFRTTSRKYDMDIATITTTTTTAAAVVVVVATTTATFRWAVLLTFFVAAYSRSF